MKHVGALDGIRGLAILLVVLFHYRFVSCGWAGVQLFFVLSGFLITSILVADADLPLKLYLQRFYWRRTLRIFPLYFGYLAALSACYSVTEKPEVFGRFWQSLFTYTLNFQRMRPGFPNNIYFGHFWSLAVEEQFYLVWPLLIFLLRPKGRQILIGALLVACPVIRALTAHFAMSASTDVSYLGQAVYSFTPGQLDAFAAGAALVVLRPWVAGKSKVCFGLLTVALLVAGQVAEFLGRGRFALDTSLGYGPTMLRNGQHIWGYSLINLWCAGLIFLVLEGSGTVRWFGHPAAVFVGKVSYGMYVFHLLVQATVEGIIGTRHGIANLAAFAVYFSILCAVCFVSYRWYESYFLNLKDRKFHRSAIREKRRAVAVAGVGEFASLSSGTETAKD
jgi:peptidoglycan/LPS O-acetylase OafA/YrhL